jgi:hypothetical protein
MAYLPENKNNCICLSFIILMAVFIIGLVIYSSDCNNKIGSPCYNTPVNCNLNNFTVYNKTQNNAQNITIYYLNLICNYESNSSCIIYDGQFYNYNTLIEYFNHYYNNSNTYTVYLHDNSSKCTFDIPKKDKEIIIVGLCIMAISSLLLCIIILGYCIPEMLNSMRRRKYVKLSDKIGIIDSPPPRYSTN